MHEIRNSLLTMVFCAAVLWGFCAWLVFPDYWAAVPPSLLVHKIASVIAVLLLGAWLWHAMFVQDKCDDELAGVTEGRYFERDGLCFMPLTRLSAKGQAEISLYYQNRFDQPCEAVVHLRPDGRAFASHRGARDVHIAFRAPAGSFGVVHQEVAVNPQSQGQTVNVEVAAAVRWPIGKGEPVRSKPGEPCGTFNIDWTLAFRHTDHELSGEIRLIDPVSVHMTMPVGASAKVHHRSTSQETLTAMG